MLENQNIAPSYGQNRDQRVALVGNIQRSKIIVSGKCKISELFKMGIIGRFVLILTIGVINYSLAGK